MKSASLLKVWQWKKEGCNSKIGPDRGACDDRKREVGLEHIGPHYYLVSDLDGDQCMRMACHVYFQERLPEPFYETQLLLNYRSLKQLNSDYCYKSSLINIVRVRETFFKKKYIFESCKKFGGQRKQL
jgi:hypothetical protein